LVVVHEVFRPDVEALGLKGCGRFIVALNTQILPLRVGIPSGGRAHEGYFRIEERPRPVGIAVDIDVGRIAVVASFRKSTESAERLVLDRRVAEHAAESVAVPRGLLRRNVDDAGTDGAELRVESAGLHLDLLEGGVADVGERLEVSPCAQIDTVHHESKLAQPAAADLESRLDTGLKVEHLAYARHRQILELLGIQVGHVRRDIELHDGALCRNDDFVETYGLLAKLEIDFTGQADADAYFCDCRRRVADEGRLHRIGARSNVDDVIVAVGVCDRTLRRAYDQHVCAGDGLTRSGIEHSPGNLARLGRADRKRYKNDE